MLIQNSPYFISNRRSRTVSISQPERPLTVFDFISGKAGAVHRNTEAPISRSAGDILEISAEMLTRQRNDYIGQSLESGEPMDGVSYDDFVQYYRNKQGFCWNDDYMHRLYSQAQKGWKASCAEHEWQTDPDFIMTAPMFSSPELAEDREKAFEKIKNGEELTRLDNELLSTFPDAGESMERVNSVVQDRGNAAYKQKLLDKIAGSGVELSPNDKITFTVRGYDIIDVKGTVDDLPGAAPCLSFPGTKTGITRVFRRSFRNSWTTTGIITETTGRACRLSG